MNYISKILKAGETTFKPQLFGFMKPFTRMFIKDLTMNPKTLLETFVLKGTIKSST